MLLFVTLMVVGTMLFAPELPVGGALRKALVEPVVRRLSGASPGRVVFWAGLAVLGFAMVALFEVEGMRLFSLMAPEIVVWFGLFDVALFLDVLIVAAAVMATTRVRVVKSQAIATVRKALGVLRRGGRARSRRPRPVRSIRPRSDDPEPGWPGLAYAG